MPLSELEKARQLNQTLWDQLARKNGQLVRQGLEIQRLQELVATQPFAG